MERQKRMEGMEWGRFAAMIATSATSKKHQHNVRREHAGTRLELLGRNIGRQR
jgi:hypothetical protein